MMIWLYECVASVLVKSSGHYSMAVQSFLWRSDTPIFVGRLAVRTCTGVFNRLNYCMIFIVYVRV